MTPNPENPRKEREERANLERVPPTLDQMRFLDKATTPLATSCPKVPLRGFEKIALDSIIGSSQVVALGEVTHGSRDIFEMKHRIFRFLVEERGFRHFAIEGSMAAAENVNDYVRHGIGDPKKAIASMGFRIWQVQEVLELVQWMREYNQKGKGGSERPESEKVSFHGFDMQFIEHPVQRMGVLIDVAEKNSGGDYGVLRAALKSLPSDESLHDIYFGKDRSGVGFNKRLTEPQRAELEAHTRPAFQCLQDIRTLVASDGDLSHNPKAQRYLHLLEQKLRWFDHDQANNATFNHRDRCMAENVTALMNEYPGQGMVLWAQNMHIQRDVRWRPQPFDGDDQVGMGQHLARQHTTDYCAFAFSFGSGEYRGASSEGKWVISPCIEPQPGSIEYDLESFRLKKQIEGPLCVDLKTSPDLPFPWPKSLVMNWQGAPVETSYENAFGPVLPSTQFNGFIFIPKTAASRPFSTTGE